MVVEGVSHELDRVLDEVRSVMAANIRSDSVSMGQCTEEFPTFEIRY